jgi:hypothetical protein
VTCTKSGNDHVARNARRGVDNDLTSQLLALHEEYAAAVNTALDEGRHELVELLADEFSEAALELMSRPNRAA